MIVVPYFLAIIIGLVLALSGAGGTILTVPILVYLMDISPVKATSYSLFVVGVTSLIGSYKFFKRREINLKVGFIFSIPSLLGVVISRKFIVHNMPEYINLFNLISIDKNSFIIIIFAILMLIASLSMFHSWNVKYKKRDNNFLFILFDGLIIGVITGFIGAGGGFLIIPTLLYFSNIRVKEAIGTSLMIITIKSLFGFMSELNQSIDWGVLLLFTFLSVIGIIIGAYFVNFIRAVYLKKSFGIFVLIMAILILIQEAIF